MSVASGVINLSEMEQNLSEIFRIEWTWQIRQLDDTNFLVRFPPHKKVYELVILPAINLKKKGVCVEVSEWIGELDPFGFMRYGYKSEEYPQSGVHGRF